MIQFILLYTVLIIAVSDLIRTQKKINLENIPDPAPVQNKNIITEPAVIPEQIKPQPVIIPAPKPDPAPVKTEAKKEPEPPKMGREQLEKAARSCLIAAGVKFDTWSYCRFKSDIELMDIITNYNLNK